MKNQFLLILSFILLIGCAGDQVKYNFDEDNPEPIILKKWHITGPLKAGENENSIAINYLPMKEEAITLSDFKDLNPEKFHNRTVEIQEGAIVDFNKIFNIKKEESKRGVVYAACVINSSKAQRVKLNFSSDDGAKIWLNHRLIFTNDRGSAITPYQNYLDMQLNPGDNFLLIKVVNIDNDWVMFTALEKESAAGIKRHKVNFELQFGNVFLSRNIIENDTVKLTWGIPENEYQLKLSGPEDLSIPISTNQNINISKLPDGFYKAMLYTPTDSFSSRFYKIKNIDLEFKQLIKDLSKSQAGRDNANIQALLHRYHLLMEPKNLPVEGYQKRNWDRRMLFILGNLKNEYKLLNKQLKDGAQRGTLFRSYRSEIDNGSQYYILHVPENYSSDKPLPLVVEMSKLMKWFPSPVETNRFANIDLIERFADMANKYQMIIVEPGCRTVDKPNYNHIDETDLWETIKDIKTAYHIDTTRIFLRGACRASYDALKVAVRHPGKFAAISTVSPEIIPENKTEKNLWLHHNDPFNFLANIKNMRFLNIHSKLDTHSLISSSDRLFKLVNQAGLKHFSYTKLPIEFKPYYSDEYMDDIFSFFSRTPALKQPQALHYSTDQLKFNQSFWIRLNHIRAGKTASVDAHIKNNALTVNRTHILSYTVDLTKLPYDKAKPLVIYDNGKRIFQKIYTGTELTVNSKQLPKNGPLKNPVIEGPLSHLFNQPFIVVTGTAGSKKESIQVQQLLDKLSSDWQRRYYTNFRVKRDTEITGKDLLDFNLLLLGSSKSNAILSSMQKQLPLKVDNAHVSIGKESLKGESLGYYLIYPSPHNPQKYVAVLGYNNPNGFRLWSERNGVNPFDDISDYGWYDFKIWDNAAPTQTISGYFNERWSF